MGIRNVAYKIEHHFESKYILPTTKQIVPDVKIVEEESIGELIIEKSDIKKCLDININGLTITLPIKAIIKGFYTALRLRIKIWWLS